MLINSKPKVYSKKILFNQIYYTIIGLLIFLMAFRSLAVGTDNSTYAYYYNLFCNGELSIVNDKLEIGFSTYFYIFAKINASYMVVQCFTSLIIIIPFVLFINLYSKNKILSVFLYITLANYFSAFNAIRQNMALAILLIGILIYLKNKNIFLYLSFVILAMLFHYTAGIFFIASVLFFIKPTWKKNYYFFTLIGLLFLFAKPFIFFLKENVDIKYIDKYIDTIYFIKTPELKSIMLTLAYIIVLILVIILQKKKIIEIKSFWMYNFFIVATWFRFCSLFGVFSYLCLRFYEYFNWALILLIPDILSTISNNQLKRIFYYLIIFGGILLMTFQIFIFKNYEIIPYSFV